MAPLARGYFPPDLPCQPYEWSADATWKERVLTKAQPFLEGTDKEKWLERKAAYKELKRRWEHRRHKGHSRTGPAPARAGGGMAGAERAARSA
jgi:hypothetical protein